jgi:hypothetical protein
MRTQEEKFSYWKEKLNSQPTQQVNTKQVQQVRAAIAQSLQAKPTLLSFTQELLKQSIRPVFEKDAAGQVIGMSYQLMVNQLAVQQGGKIVLTRDEQGKPILGVQLKRQVGPKVAQRLTSPAEKDQLLIQGYTDYLTGFTSRLGKPFAARLYFNAQNELKFSFTHTIPAIATSAPWTQQELKDFVFPGAYLGVSITLAIKKQLMANQVSEFIPRLVTKNSPARVSYNLIPEKALGPGFDFHTLSQQMGHAIQGSVIQEVERFLAQDKSQESLKTVGSVVSWQTDPEKNHTNNQQTHTSSSFLQKAWHKLGFSQEEETADNRLQRLKKRRKKRKILTLK